MKVVARELLRIAKAVLRTEMTFRRTRTTDDNKLNVIHYEVSRFLEMVRQNEGLETFVNRNDDNNTMRLQVGFSDHEAVEAIVRELLSLAEREAAQYGFEMKKD